MGIPSQKAFEPVAFFWYRRDLRLEDNAALYHALRSGLQVLPLFIFDRNILDKLEERSDKRVAFIHQQIIRLKQQLNGLGSDLLVEYGDPVEIWRNIVSDYNVRQVFANHDYEPYALQRDQRVKQFLAAISVSFYSYKDQCIFERSEIVKDDGSPYTVFTPYSHKWKAKLDNFYLSSYPTEKYFNAFLKTDKSNGLISLEEMRFAQTGHIFPDKEVSQSIIKNYTTDRNFPAIEGTSKLGVHFRFGTISIREKARKAKLLNETFLNELIWRDFYMMVLWHFPHVAEGAFRKEYDRIQWRNNETEFAAWCEGKTGYPIVDAGMRELNETGYMHNRVRMIVASFLTKHLLIDWRWGESYFAQKLLDYDMSANNGGWQWAAGSGTDAAPYFRVFNPALQAEKFDKNLEYINRWVPDLLTPHYPAPIVQHVFARKRCMEVYKAALKE